MTLPRTASAAVAGWLAAACASPTPEPLFRPPSLIRASAVRPASGLDVPRYVEASGGGREASAPAGFAVSARAMWLADPFEPSELVPLAAEVDVVADLLGEPVTLATPELTASALVARGPAARAWTRRLHAGGPERAHLLDRSQVLPAALGGPARTWEVALTSREREDDPRDWLDEFPDRGPFPRTATLRITPEGAGLRITLEITDLSPEGERALREAFLDDPDARATPPPPRHTETLRAEAVTMAVAPADDGSVSVVLQMDPPFERCGDGALVFVVEAVPLGPIELLARPGGLPEPAPQETEGRTAADESRALVRAEALEVFKARGGRGALLALARESDARVAIDLALIASSDDLSKLAAEAFPASAGATAAEPLGADSPDGAIAWRLESTSWRYLARGALTESLSPELQGVFLVHAGALALFPDVILDALNRSGRSLERFRERIVAEQLLALEDPAPSTRLRAHDWLESRDRAVEGYAPLAPRAQRQAALEAAAKEPAGAATTDGGGQR